MGRPFVTTRLCYGVHAKVHAKSLLQKIDIIFDKPRYLCERFYWFFMHFAVRDY